MKTDTQYKILTIKEFTKAASIYETEHAGIYEMCKDDYPYIESELGKEDYYELLDCGCGTGPMISLLYEKDSTKHYTGIDITPKMIEFGKAKNLIGHGDVKAYTLDEIGKFCLNAGLKVEKFETARKFRMYLVARNVEKEK